MRALGVVRVSSKAQAEDDHYSLGNQREQIAAYCAHQGWDLVRTLEYVQSGARNQRELREILETSGREGAEVVVVYELDRLSRNLISTLLFIDELRQAGVRFAAVANEIDLTTPEGELQLHLLSAFAHYFRQQLGRKVRSNQALRVREGKVFGRVKYGYRMGDDGRLVVDEEQARHVREAYRWYLDESVGMREIARRLNAMGARTKTGAQWGVSSVRLLFEDVETYRGAVTYGKWRKVKGPGAYPRIIRNDGDYLTVEDAHPRILDDETIERAQRQRRSRAGMRGQAAGSPHLLSGVLICGHCGSRMVYSRSSDGKGGSWAYYVCGAYARRGTCQRNAVRAETAERVVLDDLLAGAEESTSELAIRREVERSSRRADAVRQEIAALERRLSEAPEAARRARLALVEGDFTVDEYRATMADASAQHEMWRQRIQALRTEISDKPDVQTARSELRDRIARLDVGAGNEGLQVIIRESYARIIFKDDGDPQLVLQYADFS